MIKRKFVIIILSAVLFFSGAFTARAALLSWGISQLAPAGAGFGAGGASVPARLFANAAGGSGAKWISLFVPGAGLAKIGALVLGIGLTIAGDYLYDEAKQWFDSRQIDRYGQKDEIRSLPAGTKNVPDYYMPSGAKNASDMAGFPQTDSMCSTCQLKYLWLGIFANSTAGNAAIIAFYDANKCGLAPVNAYRICPSDFTTVCTGTFAAASAPPGFPTSGIVGGIDFSKYQPVCRRYGWAMSDGSGIEYVFCGFVPANGVPLVPQNTKRPLTPAELEAEMAGNSNDDLNRAILDAVNKALAGSDFKAKAPANYAGIQNVLKNAVTQEQKDDLEGTIPNPVDDIPQPQADTMSAIIAALKAQNLSAAQIAAAIAAATSAQAKGLTQAEVQAAVSASLQGQNLSAAQIAAAIAALNQAGVLTQAQVQSAVEAGTKTAINDATGLIPPVDPSIIMPEKLSLTAVLTTFVGQINSLPMFQTLQGLTIQVNGSSSLCLNLPANLGGSHCYDGTKMQDTLNMIGSAFLGLTALISFVGIFRS